MTRILMRFVYAVACWRPAPTDAKLAAILRELDLKTNGEIE